MLIRLVLGAAGSGKTFRCVREAREELATAPEGPALLLIAPRQGTYQLEQPLLADPAVAGYTRLRVLSFEGLAQLILTRLHLDASRILPEEGRIMVLRSLLSRKWESLKVFRASARLTGFAEQLSRELHAFQRHRVSPQLLERVAAQSEPGTGLGAKLRDLATLLQAYLDWLQANQLQDTDSLLSTAAAALRSKPPNVESGRDSDESLRVSRAWIDGFSEFSEQELDLLAALLPGCHEATVTFCLDPARRPDRSWISHWSMMERTFESCRKRLAEVPRAEIRIEPLLVDAAQGRFAASPVLQHLATHWAEPVPYPLPAPAEAPPFKPVQPNVSTNSPAVINSPSPLRGERAGVRLPGTNPRIAPVNPLTRSPSTLSPSKGEREGVRGCPGFMGRGELPVHGPKAFVHPSEGEKKSGLPPVREANPVRVVVCSDPEAEGQVAAREILRHVRGGGRFRHISVLVRNLEDYHATLQRVFARYEIPFFLDRRESVTHHPLAELTRSALRTVAFGWQHEDWFAALKSGLMPGGDKEIDFLENEALARGWEGVSWLKPVQLKDHPDTDQDPVRLQQLEERLERLRRESVLPFQRLGETIAAPQGRLSGAQLAAAVRAFWKTLEVDQRLTDWVAPGNSSPDGESIHETVWNQINAWLDNAELAFRDETLTLKEWLPILEAGLANLTVGLIPPALDQVLVGAVDRSRTPNIRLALVLGLNEGVFPARPSSAGLLNEADRRELQKRDLLPGITARDSLSRERYLAYIACTRPRDRLLLTCALRDAQGAPLNQSSFLWHLRRLLPSLEFESDSRDWRTSEHVNELISPLLKMGRAAARTDSTAAFSEHVQSLLLPGEGSTPTPLSRLNETLELVRHPQLETEEPLAAPLAQQLYGPVLRSSVSRLEQFAACPFKFFVHSGLRAEERKQFELDAKEQGTFQHDVLALFHQGLWEENKRWRDVTPREARARIAAIADGLVATFHEGLLNANEQARFLARVLSESLQDFIETLVTWMRGQYQFDPVAVELPFGPDENFPPLKIELSGGRRLELCGRIDRVDLCRTGPQAEALGVVVDYKSSQKQLDSVLLAHGIQLQLLTYLNVLRRWPDPKALFGVERLCPAGVFYVSLRGRYDRQPNRNEALADPAEARKQAYQHSGRFDAHALRHLDSRRDVQQGDQFNYRLTKSGRVYQNSREALEPAQFQDLLDSVEQHLKRMGEDIFSGVAAVAPYRKGAAIACEQCDLRSVCRMDPWTQRYRVLKAPDR